MLQPNEILKFTGTESPEEAERWLETFVDSTGSFSDTGIFRLLAMRFSVGSVAREWFNSLEDTTKVSWMSFEDEFRKKWITTPGRLEEQATWDSFSHHILSSDAIFNEGSLDEDFAYGVISAWVDEHLLLGGATGSKDQLLIETTVRLLPSFLVAYFQVYVEDFKKTFVELCVRLKSIPFQILRLEFTRRQLSSAEGITLLRREIEAISEKVDKLMNVMSQGCVGYHDGSRRSCHPSELSRGEEANTSSNDNIPWEPCSPLTSVIVTTESSSTFSELSTPTVQSTILPVESGESLNDCDESDPGTAKENEVAVADVAFHIPKGWRKSTATKTRTELVEIAREAIEFVRHCTNTSSIKYVQSHHFNSTVAIFDRLTGSQLRIKCDYWKPTEHDSLYDGFGTAISHVQLYYTYRRYGQISRAVELWSNFMGSTNDYGIFVKWNQANIVWKGNTYHVNMRTSEEISVAGGICYLEAENFVLNSAKTVQFMVLSSYLAESTGELRYKEAAVQAANTIKAWMVDFNTSLIKECLINVYTAVQSDDAILSCHLSGLAIEGFSVLASVSGDNKWMELAIKIATAAMKYNKWHTDNGILTVGSASEDTNTKAMKGLLSRGLMIAYQRIRSNIPFRNLIRSYINVQFNALYDLCRFYNSYGIDWRGPYMGPYPQGQMAAVHTLVAAIGVSD